jgi:ketosteroid isomerase-like protein
MYSNDIKEEQQDSSAPIDVVKATYAAFARGDFPAIMSLYEPDCVLDQSSVLPWGGTYHGYTGLQQFFASLTNAIDTVIVDETLFEAGDKVVSIGRTKGVSRGSGAAFELPAVHVYTIRNGKISRFEAYVDTPAMLHAVGGGELRQQ